ncbi:glycosyltransferase family 4 protein [Halioglobus sp.]|nr:glycosyltransferase family 4 protein [Halioglobus sp.]
MNILVLTSTFPRWKDDTDPRFVEHLCLNLAGEHSVHVVAPHTRGALCEETVGEVTVFRYRYFFEAGESLAYEGGILPNLKKNPFLLLLIPFFLMGQGLMVLQLLRKNHYEIIHAHWIIPQGLIALLARSLSGSHARIVLTSHGGDLFALKGRLLTRLKAWITRRADALTVVSETMREQAIAMELKAAQAVYCIPMGVDSHQEFRPPRATCPREGLLFVGRLVDKKGVEYLIRALPLILREHPGTPLVIVGDGPLHRSLRDLCNELSVADHVTFTGAVTNREIAPYLQGTAVALFPSVVTGSGDQEGSPVSIMEALACACPVVVADYPGANDIIQHNTTGLIVKGRSPQAIADAANHLLGNADLRITLGNNARTWAQEHYDWSVISAKFLVLFQELIARPDAGT